MARKEDGETTTELDTFRRRLKAIPTESILLSGKRFKEYQITETTFTKSKMWPDKYEAELRGIELAKASGLNVPEIVEHNLDEWGSITYKLVRAPRLDQTVWTSYNAATLSAVGSTLAQLHHIKAEGEPNTIVFPRRNKYFLDDMRRRASLPEDCFTYAEMAFNKATSVIYQSNKVGFVHGDFGLQNIFDTDPLTVFDWEYSHTGFPVFDIGTCLSDMIFGVTEGNWSLQNYFEGTQRVIEAYKLDNSEVIPPDEILSTLRFLGQRVPPQFYLFAIEKLAVSDEIKAVERVLMGRTSIDESIVILKSHGIEMDNLWGGKVLKALSQGGYQFNPNLWEWIKKVL